MGPGPALLASVVLAPQLRKYTLGSKFYDISMIFLTENSLCFCPYCLKKISRKVNANNSPSFNQHETTKPLKVCKK